MLIFSLILCPSFANFFIQIYVSSDLVRNIGCVLNNWVQTLVYQRGTVVRSCIWRQSENGWLTYRCNTLGPLNLTQPWQVRKTVCKMRFPSIALPTERRLKCFCFQHTCGALLQVFRVNITKLETVRSFKRGSSFPILPHPLHGDHAIYDLLNQHFIECACTVWFMLQWVNML